jgi:hypothetical protein
VWYFGKQSSSFEISMFSWSGIVVSSVTHSGGSSSDYIANKSEIHENPVRNSWESC